MAWQVISACTHSLVIVFKSESLIAGILAVKTVCSICERLRRFRAASSDDRRPVSGSISDSVAPKDERYSEAEVDEDMAAT